MQHGLTAIGDSANFAKKRYEASGYHESELYSFNLLGDPAMQLLQADLELEKTALQREVNPGDLVAYQLKVTNHNLYPARAVLFDPLAQGLSYDSYTSDRVVDVIVDGRTVTLALQAPLEYGESATVELRTVVDLEPPAAFLLNTASVSAGLDLNPSDNISDAAVFVAGQTHDLFLPGILRRTD